jgi:tetratricopeptide (TPR) repeat protein
MNITSKLIIFIFALLALTANVYAQTLREELQQMVEQLQKSPSDNALREKIITLATSIKPAPAIPEEARRSFVRGNTAFSEAKSQEDYARAVQRYEEALVIAPWWGDAYFNLAKALEQRQEYSRAIQSLKLFVLTGPTADEARKAQDYNYALEDKQEKLTKEKSRQEMAEFADPKTRLIWRRCAEGMVYSGGTCIGTASTFNFDEALHHAQSEASRTGIAWRVPKKDELFGIVDKNHRPTIDPAAFPATPDNFLFWSSSPYEGSSDDAWSVYFGDGNAIGSYRVVRNYVRLVRAGQ